MDDEFDHELRRRLRSGAAGPTADPRRELSSLTPRFERARRRRAAVVTSAGAAAVVIVVLGLALRGGSGDERIQVADSSTSAPRRTTSTSSSPSPTSTGATSTSAVPAATSPTSTTATSTVPTPTGAPSVPGDTAPAPTAAPPPAGPAPTTAAPGGQRVLSSGGGTASVTWTAASIVVDRTDPAVGWSLERVEQKEATRVVVTFRREGGGSGSSSATIDARVVDGRLQVN